jgi:hypothetical protein
LADPRPRKTRKRFVFLRLKGHDQFVAAAFESGAVAEAIALLALQDERFAAAYTASPSAVRRDQGMKALRFAYYAVEHAWVEGELDSLIRAARQLNVHPAFRARAARDAFMRALNEYSVALQEIDQTKFSVDHDLGVLRAAMRKIERMGTMTTPRVSVTIAGMPEEAADYFDRLVASNGTSRWEALVALLELHRAVIDHDGPGDEMMLYDLRQSLRDRHLDRLPQEATQVIDPTSLRAARRDSRAREYPRGPRGPVPEADE